MSPAPCRLTRLLTEYSDAQENPSIVPYFYIAKAIFCRPYQTLFFVLVGPYVVIDSSVKSKKSLYVFKEMLKPVVHI